MKSKELTDSAESLMRRALAAGKPPGFVLPILREVAVESGLTANLGAGLWIHAYRTVLAEVIADHESNGENAANLKDILVQFNSRFPEAKTQ